MTPKKFQQPAGLASRQTRAGDSFLITCEHGGNRIPDSCRALFEGHRALLETHRGYDAGALAMARTLARSFDAPLVSATISRLVVDLNRSIGHPHLFFEATRRVSPTLRAKLVQQHYLPYRRRVEELVGQAVSSGRRIVHVSSHSFTPELDGKPRRADVGLLYDPGRVGEVELCERWKASLASSAPWLRVRRNYPYAGKGDGLTSYLRQRFPCQAYVGIELEINQAIVLAGGPPWKTLRGVLTDSLHAACAVTSPTNTGEP
jgi:predicted N-formylglutamate amidohydrolase